MNKKRVILILLALNILVIGIIGYKNRENQIIEDEIRLDEIRKEEQKKEEEKRKREEEKQRKIIAEYENKVELLNSYSLEYMKSNAQEIIELRKSIIDYEIENPQVLDIYDSYEIDDFYNKHGEIMRGSMMSYTLEPKNIFRINKDKAQIAYDAFYEHYKEEDKFINNEVSIEDQYWCHFNFGKTKESWNLEPHREVVTEGDMIINKCNP